MMRWEIDINIAAGLFCCYGNYILNLFSFYLSSCVRRRQRCQRWQWRQWRQRPYRTVRHTRSRGKIKSVDFQARNCSVNKDVRRADVYDRTRCSTKTHSTNSVLSKLCSSHNAIIHIYVVVGLGILSFYMVSDTIESFIRAAAAAVCARAYEARRNYRRSVVIV